MRQTGTPGAGGTQEDVRHDGAVEGVADAVAVEVAGNGRGEGEPDGVAFRAGIAEGVLRAGERHAQNDLSGICRGRGAVGDMERPGCAVVGGETALKSVKGGAGEVNICEGEGFYGLVEADNE